MKIMKKKEGNQVCDKMVKSRYGPSMAHITHTDFITQALVVQRADNSIQRIKCTPANTFYPLDSDLSTG